MNIGQKFTIGNLDNPIKVPADMTGRRRFGGSFVGTMKNDMKLMNSLWRPNPASRGLSTRVNVKPLSERHEAFTLPEPSIANDMITAGVFAKLATELISTVYENLDHPLDMACLLMTCQRNFEIGRPHLARILQNIFTPPWAGDRLICLGSWTDLTRRDLPRGMLTEEETRLLERKGLLDFPKYVPFPKCCDHQPYCKSMEFTYPYKMVTSLHAFWHPDVARKRWLITNTIRSGNVTDMTIQSYFLHFTTIQKGEGCRLDLTQVSLLLDLVRIAELDANDLYADRDEEIMVFRNLTTKEYIRGDAVHRFPHSQPWLKCVRFENELIIRITWSSNNSLDWVIAMEEIATA
ncbi:hypothetical protein DXG03_001368 [Asterophora parasitica]|uniref:Uncharacterized protein n=1 Tax=Asterophora parasitica TaxID=117018 RepID=A0A9P7G5F5_9AGAR|nr:hypothetical protein DXG03_001368 [Asterophora parasitica]